MLKNRCVRIYADTKIKIVYTRYKQEWHQKEHFFFVFSVSFMLSTMNTYYFSTSYKYLQVSPPTTTLRYKSLALDPNVLNFCQKDNPKYPSYFDVRPHNNRTKKWIGFPKWFRIVMSVFTTLFSHKPTL